MAVRISLGRPFGPRAGGRGGRTASGRATNEKLQRISDPHGAQADKDTPKTGNKGPSNEEARTNGPIKCDRGLTGTVPPPSPTPPLCRPKFQPPQSEGAGRGLVPRGDQETGEQTFCCPHPPQQKWGRTESRPSTPPPPACPHTLTAGRHMVIQVPQGADAERQVCWDLGPAW